MTTLSVSKDLAALRTAAHRAIDAAAETRRTLPDRLTPGDGQALEYQQTLQEARDLADDPAPTDAGYPMLAAERDAQIESGANASATLTSVALEVMAQANVWNVPAGSGIKKARRKGKMLVDQATTPAAIDAARDAAIAELNAI